MARKMQKKCRKVHFFCIFLLLAPGLVRLVGLVGLVELVDLVGAQGHKKRRSPALGSRLYTLHPTLYISNNHFHVGKTRIFNPSLSTISSVSFVSIIPQYSVLAFKNRQRAFTSRSKVNASSIE